METEQICSMDSTTEFRIDVPWGHISGKIWGSLQAPPILCVHGIQDNASTFDNIIPLLPSTFCYVAIDLPGHGRSSHFPPGILYSIIEYLSAIDRVVRHFGWEKFIYMGHSLGGQVGIMYTLTFNEKVLKLVSLDCLVPWTSPSGVPAALAESYKSLYDIEHKMRTRSPPSYTEEEALRRLTEGRPTPLTREAAMFLFSRGVVKNGDGYSFSADQRLKLRFPWKFSKEDLMIMCKRIKCPIFFMRATETENAGAFWLNGDFEDLFRERLGNNFEYRLIEGSHDVHLLYPERFAQDLFNFLVKAQSSL